MFLGEIALYRVIKNRAELKPVLAMAKRVSAVKTEVVANRAGRSPNIANEDLCKTESGIVKLQFVSKTPTMVVTAQPAAGIVLFKNSRRLTCSSRSIDTVEYYPLSL